MQRSTNAIPLGYEIVVAMSALLFIVISHLFWVPTRIWGIVEYEAWLTLQGLEVYQNVFDYNMPLGPWITSLFFLVFGSSPQTVTRTIIIICCITALLINKVGNELQGPTTGLVAMSLWALWAPAFNSTQYERTLILTPFLVASLLYFHRALQGKKEAINFLLSGILLGFACLIKQHTILLTAIALLGFLLSRPKSKFGNWERISFFIGGTLLPIAAIGLYLLSKYGFAYLWYSLVEIPLFYIKLVTWNEIPQLFILLLSPLFFIASPYILYTFTEQSKSRTQFTSNCLIILWGIGSSFYVLHNLRVELLIPLLPYLCLAAAQVIVYIVRDLFQDLPSVTETTISWKMINDWSPSQLLAAMMGISIIAFSAISLTYFLGWGKPYDYYISAKMNLWNQAGEWVQINTPQNRKLFVFGPPAVYFLAKREPATPFLHIESAERNIPSLEDNIIKYLTLDPSAGIVYSPIPHVPYDKLNWDDHWPYNKKVDAFIQENYIVQAQLPGNLEYMIRK